LMMRAGQGGSPHSLPIFFWLRATAVKHNPLVTQMAPLAADYETRRLQIALAMINQEIELARLLTETYRLRQQINRNDRQARPRVRVLAITRRID
jgi:hypothetical protein